MSRAGAELAGAGQDAEHAAVGDPNEPAPDPAEPPPGEDPAGAASGPGDRGDGEPTRRSMPRWRDDGLRGRFFVTCPRGTEGALRREIAALRIAGARGDMGGVWFEGPLEMGYAVCLHARVAMRVLWELGQFPAATADELYAGARAIDWKPWLTTKTTLAVSADEIGRAHV